MMILPRPLFGSLFVVALGLSQAVGQAHSGVRVSKPAPVAHVETKASDAASAVPTAPEYRLGPEDVLDVVVWQNADLSSKGVQVRPDGRISLPVVNDMQAAGLTPMELRNAIVKGLEPQFHDQEVSVTVREVNSMRVSVVGNVKTPNRFLLRSPVTVLDAIAIAGGFIDFAKRDKICVLRRDGSKLTFNYDEFVKEPNARANFLLQPGDQVIVP